MQKLKLLAILAILAITSISISCKDATVPKPRAYFRIDLPKKEYRNFESKFPYSFQYPNYAILSVINMDSSWLDIEFPKLKATVHLTYRNLKKGDTENFEDSRLLAYKHTIKADAINERTYENDSAKVYGLVYDIKGNAASPLQFVLTDSTRHFLRGALYFRCTPNKDSLAPVIDFLSKDVEYLIETLRWK